MNYIEIKKALPFGLERKEKGEAEKGDKKLMF
jgi:hypothetical protein